VTEYTNVRRSRDVHVDTNLQEKESRSSSMHPIDIYLADFNQYFVPIIQHHWHQKIQFMLVAYGSIKFEISGETITLHEGEGIFINSNVIHMASPLISRNSLMFSILFDQSVFGGINQVGIKYVLPVVDCPTLKHIVLSHDVKWHMAILRYLQKIVDAEESLEFGFELEQKNYLGELWLIFLRNIRDLLTETRKVPPIDETRIKLMLEYIHKNCTKDISLQDIANAATLSKSECCRCFQRMLKTSPFEYLIQVRISTASQLIINTDRSISDISESVGFHGLSYFHKTFKSIMNMTPLEFRKSEIKKP